LYKNIIEIDGLQLHVVKDTEDKLKEKFVRFYYTVNAKMYGPLTEEVLAKEGNLSKEEEIQKRKYAYWENGKCKHTPCIIYRLKDGCKYRPEHDDCTSGINLRLQETVSLEPNAFKKIDLGVKMFSNRCRPVQLTPKLDTCLKYSVHLMTGLVDVWFNHYTQIGIHNLSNERVTIPEGTSMCEVHCLEHPVKLIDEYESETIDHGGELDPNSLYIDRLWKFAEGDKEIFDETKERLDKYPIEGPVELEEIHCNTVQIIEEISELNPDKIFLDFMHINIMGSEEEKIDQINELLEYQDKFLVNKSLYISSILPVVHNNEMELVLGKEDPGVDPENFRDSDGKIPELSEKEKDALLAADLSDNFKLSVTTMVELQNKEKRIREIKENLVSDPGAYKYFRLKGDILCREFTVHSSTTQFLGVYIPTCILYSVIIYVHKHFLHPSKTQTFKEFSALYYHPLARRAVKKVCESCLVCAQTRNAEVKNNTVGRERTLKPSKPRESISMDILYFPKSSKGYSYGLIIADLYSLYISFYPLKSKNSAEIAKNLRSYFAAHCPPAAVYSDNDPSFRGEVENLFRVYKVQHITSYPYTQRQNYVESQVRTFKNAYRAAVCDSIVFKNKDWDILYPLVVCRINSMISKYGMSRESIHYRDKVESSLPLITDSKIFEPLEEDLDKAASLFKERMGRFMQKRKRNKKY
jgi:hypothetical protein